MSGPGVAKPKRILLIEDNPADVRLIQEALRQLASRTALSVVANAEEARLFLHRSGVHAESPRPDLILLDLNLPGSGGRALLRDTKEDPLLRKIPVIVLTTSAAPLDIQNAYDLYANGYVIKPTGLDNLLAVLRAIEEFWFGVATLADAGGSRDGFALV